MSLATRLPCSASRLSPTSRPAFSPQGRSGSSRCRACSPRLARSGCSTSRQVSLDAASVKVLERLIAEHLAQGGIAAIASHTPLKVKFTRELELGGNAPDESLARAPHP